MADEPQPLNDRVRNRSLRPDSPTFLSWVTSGWAARTVETPARAEVADFALARRRRLRERFANPSWLVIPAGRPRVRSNDTDYRFRPHAAFAHLTGLGAEHEPEAVLVIGPGADNATLYLRPPAGRDTAEFFADSHSGEFWVGPRPGLEHMAQLTGIQTADLATLPAVLPQMALSAPIFVVADADDTVTKAVNAVRTHSEPGDLLLTEAVSELRLVKDTWEIQQMRQAIAATISGFEQVVQALPRAVAHPRGERVVEGTFLGHARIEGNYVGYETIAACGDHATILHWTDDDGPVRPGELLLLDAGVEIDSLYTADLTRTLPVDGVFTPAQEQVYQAVLDAADAAFAVVRPGIKFRDIHEAAMKVLADRLSGWGLLPVTPQTALRLDQQQHRRWMVHGTSHHLGLDVHDCAQARRDMYLDGILEPGMLFTIEPGLYFQPDDELAPAQFRGIGIRIEDNILVTTTGAENLSAALPRAPRAVEKWMAGLLPHKH